MEYRVVFVNNYACFGNRVVKKFPSYEEANAFFNKVSRWKSVSFARLHEVCK